MIVCNYVHMCLMRNRLLVYGSVFFQAEDGIRDLVRSRGLGDVYKRQCPNCITGIRIPFHCKEIALLVCFFGITGSVNISTCLLYTSDAADERSSVDLGGRRIIKKKKTSRTDCCDNMYIKDIEDTTI